MHRKYLIACFCALCITAVVAPVVTMGQDDLVSQKLFEQGMQLYAQGRYGEAQQALHHVDAMQLSKEQRVSLYETLQSIERRLEKAADPEGLLRQAQEAQKSGDLSEAMRIYQSVLHHPESDTQQKQQAEARIAEINRRLNADLTRARQTLDEAIADIRAGRLEVAQQKLQRVKASGVDLGWFDNERLDRQLAVIAERRGGAASQTAVEDSTSVEQPPVPRPTPQRSTTQIPPQPTINSTPAVAPASLDLLSQLKLLRSQEKFAQGQQAEEDGEYFRAFELYQQAVNLDPDNQKAKDSLLLVQTKMGGAREPRNVLEMEIETRKLRAKAAIAEFEQLMNRATNLLGFHQYAAAREAVQQAKITLDLNQQFLPIPRYRTLRDNAVNLAAQIADAERVAKENQARELEVLRREEAEQRRQEALEAQEEEVQRLLQRASQMRKEQKYDQALELLNQALFLDPTNVAAQAMKEMIEDSKVYVEARDIYRKRGVLASEQSNDNLDATIPYTDLIQYPADWPQISASRLSGLEQNANESEINRRVALKLRESVPINFDDNKLTNVIDYLRQTTNVNIFVNWPALEALGVSQQETRVSLQLTNIPADKALRLVLQQVSAGQGLEDNPITFSIIDGIVTISTERDLSKTTDIRPYDIRDLLVQVPNFINAPVFDLNEALSNTNSGGSSGGGGTKLFDEDSEEEERLSRTELIEQIVTLLQDTVGKPEEWAAYGGNISSLRELNGLLIVKTTPENHRQISQLLGQLRETRALQIAVESRFLIVDQNFLDEVGVDLDLQVPDPGGHFQALRLAQDSFSLAQSASNSLVPGSFGGTAGASGFSNFDTVDGVRTATGGREIVTDDDGLPLLIDNRTGAPVARDPLTGQLLPAPIDLNGNIIPDSAIVETVQVAGSGAGFDPRGRSFDFGISFLDDLEVNLLIRATQANRRAITLTSPRLTLFNGQRSYVVVARQVGFVSDLEPIPNSAGFDPTISVVQSGVILDVEATVSADRRYVTMTVRPSLATLPATFKRIEQSTTLVLPGEEVGLVNAATTAVIEVPEVELTTLRTTVSVPDRGTLLLGGQRIVADVEVEAGVPVMSKIPVLNRLFTNRSTVKDERTLLILIKPTIIIQSEEEENLFPGLLQNPQQFGMNNAFGR